MKPQDYISPTINTEFLFLQERPGFNVDRKRNLRRKIHSRHRFMTTTALYSTTERAYP